MAPKGLAGAALVQGAEKVHSILYTRLVMGYPEWVVTLAVLAAFTLVVMLILWCPWVKRAPGKELRALRQSAALAVWLTIVGYSGSAWVLTIWRQSPRASWYFITAFFILTITFILEGLEIAYTELRDKDLTQFPPRTRAARIFEQMSWMGETESTDHEEKRQRMGAAFSEAREWSVVLLLVIASLMLERGDYWIPWVAHVVEEDHWGKVARVAITIILTTFPFVWLAQSPGKWVARQNSVEFIQYRFSDLTILLLRLLWRVMRAIGLQFPAEEMDAIALRILKNCQRERNLLPSEYSFFADGLKKYGYGFLMAHDTMEIQEDGSCIVTSWNLSYFDVPRQEIKRFTTYEEGFAPDTLEKLRHQQESACWAFESPMIGERVTPELEETWRKLFQAVDPNDLSTWPSEGYTKISTGEWLVAAEFDGPPAVPATGGRKEQKLTVTLDMRESLPHQKNDLPSDGQKAMLVLWRIRTRSLPGMVPLPAPGVTRKTTHDYWKKYSNPCLRSTVSIEFHEISAFRFVGKRRFAVTYEDVEHPRETERFSRSYSPAEDGEKHKFCFHIDSPLPAARYKALWDMEKKHPD